MMNFTYGVEEAITPLDGRNKHKIKALSPYFSEFALDKYRILAELRYLQKLSEYGIIRKLTKNDVQSINRLYISFSVKDYRRIREIEKKTNHDLKAVEEWIKEKLQRHSGKRVERAHPESDSGQARMTLSDVSPMVHFGLTSDDTNNISHALIPKK